MSTVLLLASLSAGCAPDTAVPPAVWPTAPEPGLTATASRVEPSPTPAPVAPTPTATPGFSSGTVQATAAETIAATRAAEQLVSHRVSSPPAIDGSVESNWIAIDPLRMPLTWGTHGTEHALDVELRALYTDQAIYFLAQWAGQAPSGDADTTSNELTVHWRIPDAAARRLDCDVACHTAFADGTGRFVYANAETIPQGGDEALPVAGRWEEGAWTLEWSRPLLDSNPFDLQFDDLDARYTFMVKVFEGIEGRPDPVSERYTLIFER